MNTTRLIGIILLMFTLLGAMIGYMQSYPITVSFWQFLTRFFIDLSPQLATIIVTVLVLDFLNERREQKRMRWQLIHEMASQDNHVARRAAFELSERGWLMDGHLENVDLRYANLTGANLANANFCHANLQHAQLANAELQNADLSEADLYGANLSGAQLQNANLFQSNISADQLAQVYSLEGATLPDGTLQQGPYLAE